MGPDRVNYQNTSRQYTPGHGNTIPEKEDRPLVLDGWLHDTPGLSKNYHPVGYIGSPCPVRTETLEQAIYRIARAYQILNRLYNPENGSNIKYARDI